MIWRKILCLCILLQDAFTNKIDFDYYFSSSTRSHMDKMMCDLAHKLSCQIRCRSGSAMCISNKCYCVSVRLRLEPGYLPDSSSNEFTDLNDASDVELERDGALLGSSTSDQHPALRHHIAHFCPNLELARQCINKCLKRGKPAFCGKDHVCYCGHRYSNQDDNTKIDPKATYSMFKDMYKKYFGADDDNESNDNDKDHGDADDDNVVDDADDDVVVDDADNDDVDDDDST